jgi:hypothetical protein
MATVEEIRFATARARELARAACKVLRHRRGPETAERDGAEVKAGASGLVRDIEDLCIELDSDNTSLSRCHGDFRRARGLEPAEAGGMTKETAHELAWFLARRVWRTIFTAPSSRPGGELPGESTLDVARLREHLAKLPPVPLDRLIALIELESTWAIARVEAVPALPVLEPVTPGAEGPLSPCEADCLAFIKARGEYTKREVIIDHFRKGPNLLYGESTVREALARLAGGRKLLTKKGKGRGSEGYGLPGWREAETG